jgi:hypothetical protein
MGRIIFLSAMALMAYRYIARSNKKHEGIAAAPSAGMLSSVGGESEVALLEEPRIGRTRSLAAEPDPLP